VVTLLTDANTNGFTLCGDPYRFCLSIAPVRQFARKLDLKDISNIGDPVAVQVFPGHDMSDRDGLGGIYNDTYGVHVLMLQHVGAEAETQCPWLMLLRSQIAEFLSGQVFTCTAALHPFANSHIVAVRHGPEGVYDLARLESTNVFYSDMILTNKAGGFRRNP
jgi:hypothetical protein